MEMTVHLEKEMFKLVESGIKDVEVRVNDEKRKKLKVGDKIIFLERPNEEKRLEKTVEALEYYDNLSELVEHYKMKSLYYEDCTKEKYIEDMEKFYTLEEIKNYGVVAITFE